MNELQMMGEKQFKFFITTLDSILTGKQQHELEHTYKNQIHPIEDWVWDSSPYYLSDGGYSRIYFLEVYREKSKQIVYQVVLGSESTERVKLVWDSNKWAGLFKNAFASFINYYMAALSLVEEDA